MLRPQSGRTHRNDVVTNWHRCIYFGQLPNRSCTALKNPDFDTTPIPAKTTQTTKTLSPTKT